jgi:hypothetical protein
MFQILAATPARLFTLFACDLAKDQVSRRAIEDEFGPIAEQ